MMEYERRSLYVLFNQDNDITMYRIHHYVEINIEIMMIIKGI